MRPEPETLQEVTVHLPSDLVDYLVREAEYKRVSAADILQQAIANYRFLRERIDAGANVLLDERGKSLQKVDLPSL